MNQIETVMKQGLEEFKEKYVINCSDGDILDGMVDAKKVTSWLKTHQKDLLAAVLIELKKKVNVPWDYYNDIEGKVKVVPLEDIETLINNSTGV